MKRMLVTLVMVLAGVANAAAAVDPSIRAEMGRQNRQLELYTAARAQLVKDRQTQAARARQLSQQVAEAKRNRGVFSDAALKALLRDALEVSKQLEASDRKLELVDRMSREAVDGMERSVRQADAAATAAERADLHRELNRARGRLPASDDVLPAGFDITVTAGMDSESIQERADLAGDYEDKFRREAARTDERIRELQAQASLANEALNLAMDRQLFDEDMRSLTTRSVVGRTQPQSGGSEKNAAAGGNNNAAAAGNTANAATGGGVDDGRANNNPPPAGSPGNAFNNDSPDTAASPTESQNTMTQTPAPAVLGSSGRSDGLGMGRSMTVVDSKTFSMLRENGPTAGSLSPAEEMRQLQLRKERLLRAAAQLKMAREELTTRARQSSASVKKR